MIFRLHPLFWVVFLLPAVLQAQNVNVKVLPVTAKKSSERVSYVGAAESLQQVSIPAKKEGIIATITGKEGKTYNAGDVLIVLDKDAAQINLTRAELNLRTSLNAVIQQENALESLVNSYLFQEFSVDLARKDFEREKELHSRQMSSDLILDTTEKKLKAEELTLEQSRISLEGVDPKQYKPIFAEQIRRQLADNVRLPSIQLKGRVDYTPLSNAVLAFENNLNEYRRALLDLTDANITAPFSGTVLQVKRAEKGQYVGKGVSLIEYGNIRNIEVQVHINQSDLSLVRLGETADIQFDAVPGKTFKGTIRSFAQQGSSTNRTFPVKLTVKNDAGEIKPGYSARVTFLFASETEDILIPSYAVQMSGTEAFVFVVTNNTANKVPVLLGRTIGQEIQVVEGLTGGEMLVVRGQGFLNDKDTVNVITN